MEECNYSINGNDYAIIMMGCGVGYFLMGYFVTTFLYSYRQDNQMPILAEEVNLR